MEEEDEIQAQQSCKFPRVGNEEENGSLNRFNNWHHHSSRIIRVSRASGGKDRHSKVMTSKGLRDRRVRLSVTTAIQFYDLQDRLGYDQPSKAVEWLIKSASDAISELPSLNNSLFSDNNNNNTNNPSEQGGVDSVHDAEMVVENGENNYHQSQNLSLSKSGCSSTSETSKGSGLSLSRSDVRVSRVKARERARERTAKEKEKENHDSVNPLHHHQHQQHQNVNSSSISQTASFTELLTGGINNAAARSPRRSVEESNFFNKARQQQQQQQQQHQQQQQQWSSSSAPMDHYFSPVLIGTPSSSRTHHHHHHQHLGHSLHDHQSMTMSNSVSPFSSGENQNQHQFSFIPDHMMQNVVTSSSTQPSDYNLNFTISSGLAGYNRGTLQSNSPSLLSHLQRFSVSSLDGSNNLPFFMGGGGGGAASTSSSPASGSPAMENNHPHPHHHHNQIQHHPFSSVFDGSSLQLYSDQKGKPKN
ncbi:transcription factor TCP2 [Lathyrus oleraceus]|uniref:Transcription factor TCP2 n=1 Tax=Pisum sativum TaxID=3888 RepID=A0A9D4VL46_PEA|nr:transcription factor TCP2-like [Pisum sativum]XP_050893783.1 transcription factor TCP2-like [Pisum sativum]XP_050893784.1 transcription factor TCP2-like [Pisum sativum]XP_050893785.1 transcription factor TCP2-like [Pisum sativum]KAI5385278.1 hypothetical protein KIW84_072035 [Pisum sativum]